MINKVGLIPIKNYIKNLDSRNFGKSMIIKYTKDNYTLDITKEIQHFEETEMELWNGDLNLYEEYDKENPSIKTEDGTRQYFIKYGRKRFLKFTQQYEELENQDKVIPFFKPKDVHHIFPLMYGGNNNILNLSYVSRFTHDLLHNNPLEEIEKCCFQGYDYLSYLGNYNLDNAEGFKYLNDKYNFYGQKNNKKMIYHMYCGALEEEMDEFYKYINNQNLKGIGQIA